VNWPAPPLFVRVALEFAFSLQTVNFAPGLLT
jgi:hypothetical protein